MDYSKNAEKNKILEVRVGSHLYGTSTESSDIDLYGIFMPFDEIVFGMNRCEDVNLDVVSKNEAGRNTKDAIDCTLAEYRKFVRLALQNNPNILNVLFVDKNNILFQDEGGFAERLLDKAHLFPHKGAYHRYVGYAKSQLHKMRIKPVNFVELKNGLAVLDRYDDHCVMADVLGSVFKDDGNGKHVKCGDISIERGVSVKKAKRMIRDRINSASSRLTLYEEYGYDLKFASALIMLLAQGIEVLLTGCIKFPLVYRDDILAVKNGDFSLDEIVKWAESLMEEAKIAFDNSKLPEKPRSKEIEKFAMSEVKRYLFNR